MWSTRFVFLHVPRTGGTALTNAFGHLPNVSKDILRHKHAPAAIARRDLVGLDLWNTAQVFCVIRDPWEIVWSYYNLLKRSAKLPYDGSATPTWLSLVHEAETWSIEQFVERRLLTGRFVTRGGFVRHYADLPGVTVLKSVDDAYRLLVDLTSFDPSMTIRPFTSAPNLPIASAVRDWCHADGTLLAT